MYLLCNLQNTKWCNGFYIEFRQRDIKGGTRRKRGGWGEKIEKRWRRSGQDEENAKKVAIEVVFTISIKRHIKYLRYEARNHFMAPWLMDN